MQKLVLSLRPRDFRFTLDAGDKRYDVYASEFRGTPVTLALRINSEGVLEIPVVARGHLPEVKVRKLVAAQNQ